jgi:hypothetical protein
MSCTCIKDHTITCRVHPHEYQQIEVMGKHIAKIQAVVDMTREILVEAEDYEKRTGKTISWLNKLRDAIKEVE